MLPVPANIQATLYFFHFILSNTHLKKTDISNFIAALLSVKMQNEVKVGAHEA